MSLSMTEEVEIENSLRVLVTSEIRKYCGLKPLDETDYQSNQDDFGSVMLNMISDLLELFLEFFNQLEILHFRVWYGCMTAQDDDGYVDLEAVGKKLDVTEHQIRGILSQIRDVFYYQRDEFMQNMAYVLDSLLLSQLPDNQIVDIKLKQREAI